jgi:thiol-disulfide isomerase/thioredoxin
MSRRWFRLACLVLFMTPAGCGEKSSPAREAGPAISLTPISFADWQEKLASWHGDVVVVDVWATWCLPCLERFPHMVGLSEQYGGEGVRFVSLSLDDRGDRAALDRARRFLIEQNAVFENYLMDEPITDGFGKLDLQSIPAVLIYDRDGRLAYRLTGDDPNNQFTMSDVEEAVRDLLHSDA